MFTVVYGIRHVRNSAPNKIKIKTLIDYNYFQLSVKKKSCAACGSVFNGSSYFQEHCVMFTCISAVNFLSDSFICYNGLRRVGPVNLINFKPEKAECDKYLFLTEYEYPILFGFQKSPNTEYRILFVIEKIRITNTEYYSVARKFEYRIWIVLFGLTIRIPNTKYRIIFKILEKTKLI